MSYARLSRDVRLISTILPFSIGLLHSAGTAEAAPAVNEASPKAPLALEEVVVTAQRRNEKLQDVPVAITTVSSAELAKARIESTMDLSAVTPGLTSFQNIGFVMPHIRGIGNTTASVGIENPVATYVDGVYYASLPGALLALNNISQVEVDKGPQGTLFGRNATGGVIQVNTLDPKHEFSGNLSAGYGNYDTASATLYMTGGLSDTLAANMAAYYNQRFSGYGENIYTGHSFGKQSELALRTTLLWTLTAIDTVRISLDYESSRGSQFATQVAVKGEGHFGEPALPATSSPWTLNAPTDPLAWQHQGGITLNVSHDFDFARLVNIAAYRRARADVALSFGRPPFDIGPHVGQGYSQFSEELQLISKPENRIKWVTGIYYLDAPQRSQPFNLIGEFLPVIVGLGTNPYTDNTVTDQSTALYAQTTIPLTGDNKTNLTIGARYTWEQRGVSGEFGLLGIPASVAPIDARSSYHAPTWHVGLDHHFNDNLMAYVSQSRGYKAGTFNSNGGGAEIIETPITPEKLDAYQAGVKSEFFDRRVQFNAAAFFYSYNNIQVPIYTATAVTVLSGPKAHLYGADFDATMAVTEQLQVRAGLALLHSEFVSFPNAPFFSFLPGGGVANFPGSADGKQLPVSPNVTFDLSATYNIPLNGGALLALSGSYYYESKWYAGPDNQFAAPESHLFNANVAWTSPNERYEIEFWARNILNEPIVATYSVPAPWGPRVVLMPPRTMGGSLRLKF